MRRIALTLAAAVIATAALAVNVLAQRPDSLGDAARAARQEKKRPAKKVFTNEDLPTQAVLSVVGPAEASSEAEEKNEDQDKDREAETKPSDKKPGTVQKDGEDKKENAEAKENPAKLPEKLADEDKKISLLEKEVDLMQREYKMRVAAYYADAGLQLRDPKAWAEEETKYQADLADKQKQLSEAKAERENLQEEARHAGQPTEPSPATE